MRKLALLNSRGLSDETFQNGYELIFIDFDSARTKIKMDKQAFIYMLIEAVLFLIPLATLFIKVGRLMGRIEDMEKSTENLPSWKATMNEKVATLELNDIAQNKTLNSINDNLIKISTQVQLLLDNKIKMGELQ